MDFSYVPDKPVLRDLSLYAKPGQKIAFVGSTGAGKTTITNLINRFYDIESGSITYDGIDVRRIRKDDLRRSLGMVLQDTHLFTGTVMENIRYGRLEATDDECIRAAKIANAHYFISHLPQGYDTVLYSDGANLSQGQRQLVAIARAAVSRAPVLILDGVRHRPPAVHRPQRQCHHGAGAGPHHRAGRPPGAAGAEGKVLSALPQHDRIDLTVRRKPHIFVSFRRKFPTNVSG